MKVVGIDLGGSKILAVLMNENGRILKKIKTKTPNSKTKIINEIEKIFNQISKKEKINKIGLSIAGMLNHKKTTIKISPNIPTINGFNLKTALEKKLEKEVILENDANCFLHAELASLKTKKKTTGIVIGTGLGGAYSINGKIFPGEFGHIFLKGKIKCGCGKKGCIETFVGKKAILKRAKKNGLKINSLHKLELMAKKGNPNAIKTWNETAYWLGLGFIKIIKKTNPKILFIGGGLGKVKKLLVKPAIKEMEKKIGKNKIKIIYSKHKDTASAFGAGLLALKK